MKTLLIILAIILGFSECNAQLETDNLIAASCCDSERGCTGSSYCKACKNCTGCRHCAKNGGSCGVCNGGRARSFSSSKKKNPNTSLLKFSTKYDSGDNLVVISTTLNLREGPSTKFKVIEKLFEQTEVILIEIVGSWLKVRVPTSKNTGYVYYKYVK